MSDQDVDLRVFTGGASKSHVYRAGDDRAICGGQYLRDVDSSDLPPLGDPAQYPDLCAGCRDRLDSPLPL